MPGTKRSYRLSGSIITLALFISLMVLPAAATVRAAPLTGDFFEYDYNTHLTHGYGSYDGYSETMKSHSRYQIVSVDGDRVTVHAQGSWTWSASDGNRNNGAVDLTFNFSLSTRKYLDVVDVEGPYVDPSVWFWINPFPVKGQDVPILDDTFTVSDASMTEWMGLVPHTAARLDTTGQYTRNDVYGLFSAGYTDTYIFDKNTGYIVSEKYVEQDSAGDGGFQWNTDVKVTSSSYATPINWVLLLSLYVALPSIVAVILVLIWLRRRGPSRLKVETANGTVEVRIKRIRRDEAIETLTPGGSRYFAPFLQVIAKRALSERDPVAIASSGYNLMGMVTYDRESNLGSLFAMDESVAKAFIKRVRMRDFFVEVNGSTWDLSPAMRVDAFEILELKNPRPSPFDRSRIRPMTQDDLPSVCEIASAVYKGSSKKWIKSCFEGGDVAFVAQDSGRVVGFGFATVSQTSARLHTLTILPEFRASGLGSDIMSARLSVLYTLGVERVIVEISKHNVASMTVATNAGFARVGETAFYSSSPQMMDSVYQRRF